MGTIHRPSAKALFAHMPLFQHQRVHSPEPECTILVNNKFWKKFSYTAALQYLFEYRYTSTTALPNPTIALVPFFLLKLYVSLNYFMTCSNASNAMYKLQLEAPIFKPYKCLTKNALAINLAYTPEMSLPAVEGK